MKFNYFLLLILLLSACGQTGPLYLASDKPPIAVAPKAKKQIENEKQAISETQEKIVDEKPPQEQKTTTTEIIDETPPDLNEEAK
ncbi:MAG: hypothetical protein GQ569_07185 [Methylococcaceae bacterium]|nr:hypothetical protein [Methylococcaceae bacterium]